MLQYNLLQMPILSACVEQSDKFDGVVALHINHCMDNSFFFTEKLGEVYDDVVFIAVPYNNRKLPDGCDFTFYSAVSSGEQYTISKNNQQDVGSGDSLRHCVDNMIAIAIRDDIMPHIANGKKVVIFEDGGYHYDVVSRLIEQYDQLAGAILGSVEQTTSGAVLSHANEKVYPTFSVCRSHYKMRVESHFVVRRVIDCTIKIMRELNDFIDFKNIISIGYGVIGRTLCHQLRAYSNNIAVLDILDDVNDYARREGFDIWQGAFDRTAVVFGNVGKPSFSMDMLDSFINSPAKKLYLVSASSKRDEFREVIPYLESCPSVRTDTYSMHDIANGKRVFLLANGYPINFCDKQEESLTFGIIDPVFSQMFLLSKLLVQDYIKGSNSYINTTYYLGDNKLIDQQFDEDALVAQWCNEYDITLSIQDFNIHDFRK